MNPFQITFGSEKNWRLELDKAAHFHKLWRLLQSSEILVQLFWGLSPVVCVRCPTVILLLNCTYIWCNYYHNKGFCCVCVKCSNISNIIDMNAQMTWERLWSSHAKSCRCCSCLWASEVVLCSCHLWSTPQTS